MDILYKSTRSDTEGITASKAILKGLADDGGLFVPDRIPELKVSPSELKDMDYKATAYEVMRLFLTDYSEEELKSCIERAYDEKFDDKDIAPLKKVGDRYFLELFHGKTIAFKDMALSILPHLLTTAIRKNNSDKEVVILTATSGDTGKAALAGFSDVEHTRIIVFYPKGGVSRIQELQMVTEKGRNTKVVAVRGNFDDCQSQVKAIFNDEELKKEMASKGFAFSSANSINIGRLIPQVAYYVYAYGRMLKEGYIKDGEEINFTVPTGNFGNILAGYYAKLIGLPIGKLVCASNDNKVLYDFFETGIYDKNREFILTSSPSMDILISSNLERLIYMIGGSDAVRNEALMKSLKEKGRYEITGDMREKLESFAGFYSTEEEVSKTIKELYTKDGYITDTHTAVAVNAERKYRESLGDCRKNVIVSTASPYKFAKSVYDSIKGQSSGMDDFEIIDKLEEMSKVKIPPAIHEIRNAKILHDEVCDREGMKDTVKKSLGL
ncbi:MAG: threonine synthase [Lachnospiraceae bacterium]|nr:threonine synthase [Lachnospiraceae bacterium]